MILLDQAGAGASGSRLFPPPRALELVVEHFWIQRTHPGRVRRSWRVIPDASSHVILVLTREDSRSVRVRCTLVGPRSHFVDVSVANRIFTCGARLHPGALPLLTQLPASDFTDQSVPVAEVFGARGRSLVDQLGELESATPAIAVIANFLQREFSGGSPPHSLWNPEISNHRVKDVAAQLGVSIRTLQVRSLERVGLAPKRFLRIERLHRTLAICRNPSVSWAQAAVMGGFADQAHMIREFHDLLGESPTAWKNRARLPICSRQVVAS